MRKGPRKSKFFTPGRNLTLLLIVLLITGVFAEHVFAIQPEGDPERGVYEGRLAELDADMEEDAELLTGAGLSDSGIMTEENMQEDSECLITLEAGESAYFTDEEGQLTRTILVTAIRGQYFSQILPDLPVPVSEANEQFAGWRLYEDGISSGDLTGIMSGSEDAVLEQDCTLCAVWEKSFAGNLDQEEPEEDPGDLYGQEFDAGGSTDDGQIQPGDGAYIEQPGTDNEQFPEENSPEEGQPVMESGPYDDQFQANESTGDQDPELPETEAEAGVADQDPEVQETEVDSIDRDPVSQETEADGTDQDPEAQETEADIAELTPEQEQAQTGETSAEEAPAAAGGTQSGQENAQEKGQETDLKEADLLAADLEEEVVSENAANATASNLTLPEKSKEEQESSDKAMTVASVTRKKIQKAVITLSRTSYAYKGKAIKPGVTVVYGKTTLKKDRDYKVSYSSNVSIGTATVKITGIEKFEGSVKKTFKIVRAAQDLTLKASASRVSVGSTMTLKASGAKETAKYSFKTANAAIAKVSSTGKITGVKVGTVKITVSTPVTKNYKAGTKTITVKVAPAATKSLKAANQAGGIKLTWAKVAGANGYYIYRDGKRIATISKGTTVTYLDKGATANNRKYTYKIVAKASTGASTLSKSVGITRKIKVSASTSTTARYCLESRHVAETLSRSGKNDLAVIDPDKISKSLITKAKSRGVVVYGYINAGALESSRSYYNEFKSLRLAEYDGWDGEYWVDVTKSSWKNHLIEEAKKQKAAGVTGVYFDNVEVYYMVKHGFDGEHLYRDPPSQDSIYKALSEVIKKIENEVGIVVMPNCGDTFVRRFEKENPGVIREVNVEGVLYEDFEKTSHEEEKYLTDYLDWCAGRGMITRGIEYTSSSSGAEKARAYYKKHGWTSVYVSRHQELEGD